MTETEKQIDEEREKGRKMERGRRTGEGQGESDWLRQILKKAKNKYILCINM